MKEILKKQLVYYLLIFFLSAGIGYYVKKFAAQKLIVGAEDNKIVTATSEYDFKDVEEEFKRIQEEATAPSEEGDAAAESDAGASCAE